MNKLNRLDFVVERQINPKNKHLYVFILDKVSLSSYLVIGPRSIHVYGIGLNITTEEINILQEFRTKEGIENYKTYELTDILK